MDKRKIAILGGDSRFSVLADRLGRSGYECAVWKTQGNDVGAAVKSADWQGAVNRAEAVILPLPCTVDGERLNVFSCEPGPLLYEIIGEMEESSLLLAGKTTESLQAYAEQRNIALEDYYRNEIFEIKNVLPTVEGAIFLGVEHLTRTVCGAHFAVIGYGRIGKLLADRLIKLGACVTVYARREESRALAELYGCRALPLQDIACDEYDLLFNTVPVDALSSVVKCGAPSVCIDIAPQSKLSDSPFLQKCNVRVINASALPGRFFPTTAGEILAECILEFLQNKGRP